MRAAVVAVRPDADELRPDGRRPRGDRRDRVRRHVDRLIAELPDGATVATIGWPELTARPWPAAVTSACSPSTPATRPRRSCSDWSGWRSRASWCRPSRRRSPRPPPTSCCVEAEALDATTLLAATGSAVLAAAAGARRHAGVVRGRTWSAAAAPMLGAIVERVAHQADRPVVARGRGDADVARRPRRRPRRPDARPPPCGPSARWRPSCCAPGSCSVRSRTWPAVATRSPCPRPRSPPTSTSSGSSTWPRSAPPATPTWWPCGTRCSTAAGVLDVRQEPEGRQHPPRPEDHRAGRERRRRTTSCAASSSSGTARLLEDYDEILDIGDAGRRQVPGPGASSDEALPFIEAQAPQAHRHRDRRRAHA